jgi:hypothetical protein
MATIGEAGNADSGMELKIKNFQPIVHSTDARFLSPLPRLRMRLKQDRCYRSFWAAVAQLVEHRIRSVR